MVNSAFPERFPLLATGPILVCMKNSGFGIREVFALLALAVAAVIGFLFLDPSSTDNAAVARPTPTAVSPVPADGLTDWELTYVESGAGGDTLAASYSVPTLALDFNAAPIPDIADDQWSVFAFATFEGPPGRYLLSVTFTGEIGVILAGEERKVSPAVGDTTLRLPFEQGGEPTRIQLRLRDVSGRARLQASVLVHP